MRLVSIAGSLHAPVHADDGPDVLRLELYWTRGTRDGGFPACPGCTTPSQLGNTWSCCRVQMQSPECRPRANFSKGPQLAKKCGVRGYIGGRQGSEVSRV